ncbi:uncharacterized protein LOC143017964 [Oratosquilla oratoria]|uniref:uncharacterized protein LOC143017964 n=1 Tax=Oratosquilla oratoria TaxID=337810 RepID=UPI003F763EB1
MAHNIETLHAKKLFNLHGGLVRNEVPPAGYVNLTNYELTPAQQEFLNLGLNCHFIKKPKDEDKRIEMEILIDQLNSLQHSKKASFSSNMIDELIGEASRLRGRFRSSILTPTLKVAAKELREAEDIIIRRGDKASVFVILNKENYFNKMDNILEDTSKFLPINHDNTEQLKKKLCSLVEQIKGTVKFSKPIGDYKPGYAYGTVKTHKPGNPLRPIISQISSPTYQIAKSLNRLLTPDVPNSFCLSSATDFIDILKSQESFNHIASMDVTSLFTHVPIQETIDIIIQKVYHSQRAPLDIPENTLRQLLLACTKEVPFYSHRGDLFQQIDGVAMGPPPGRPIC